MTSAVAPAPRPAKVGVRRRSPGWVPNQHGAWAMLIAPIVVGAWPRPTWWHVVLLGAAIAAFCALYAVGLWLKSGRKARYARPALVHSAVTVALVAVLIVGHPRLLAWAWIFVPGLALSLLASARRQDRSWWNDVVLVALCCSATLVSAGLRPLPDGVASPSVLPSPFAWPPPGWNDFDARVGAFVLFMYFLGTVVHVKALIRERRNRRVQWANVGYHGLLLAVVLALVLGGPNLVAAVRVLLTGDLWPLTALIVLAMALFARSCLIPWRWPTMSPQRLGIIEIVLTLATSVVAIALGTLVLR